MTSNTEPELLPCPNPWCDSHKENHGTIPTLNELRGEYLYTCGWCDLAAQTSNGEWYSTEENARDVWNTRSTPPKAEPTDGAPETIWVWFSDISNRMRKWSFKPFEEGDPYTRKDLFAARIAELEGMNANMQTLLDRQTVTLNDAVAKARYDAIEMVARHAEGRLSADEIRALKSEGEG